MAIKYSNIFSIQKKECNDEDLSFNTTRSLGDEFFPMKFLFNNNNDLNNESRADASVIITKSQRSGINFSSDSNTERYEIIESKQRIIRILVVDDEKLIRQINCNLIKKLFNKLEIIFEIKECEDGFDLSVQIEEKRY